MKKILLIVLITFTSLSYAQKAELTVIDPDIDASEFKESYNVHYGSTHVSSLPDREEREEFFSNVKEVKGWDELLKDIFYMDLRSLSLKDLKKKYPNVSEKTLKSLKQRF